MQVDVFLNGVGVNWCEQIHEFLLSHYSTTMITGKLEPYFNVFRLVNENEVKQWKEQAEKMRKGIFISVHF